MNKGRSGRRITTRTQENFELVWQALERNQERTSARRDGLGISPSLFWYPYKMVRCHNLKVGDNERCSHFCQWLLHQCNK